MSIKNPSSYDKIFISVQEKLKKEGKDYTLETIEKLFRSQFLLVRNVINDGNWYNVRLKYLGIFGVKRLKLIYVGKSEKSISEYEKDETFTTKSPSGKDITIRVR